MSDSANRQRWFHFLYGTRVCVWKESTPIMNLSLIFVILAVVSAPWVAVGGLIAALALGYRFGIEKNAAGFCGNFDDVVRDAKQNVKKAVDSVVRDDEKA